MTVKYPRIMVSNKRHTSLDKEARRRAKAGEPAATMQEVAEEMFRKSESTN